MIQLNWAVKRNPFRPIVGLVFGTVLLTGFPAAADLADTLQSYTGYTIVYSKTISGWVSEDGSEHGDDFEGCDIGRKIIFTDDTYLTCESYNYTYSYRPVAAILSNGTNVVMIVEDDAYDMR